MRDAWIADDLHGWLDANGIYPGLPDDLAAAQKQDELYIVTTKQVLTGLLEHQHQHTGCLAVPSMQASMAWQGSKASAHFEEGC